MPQEPAPPPPSRPQFESRAEYYAWNEEMIRQYDPAKYYQFSLIRLLESARFRHILRTLRTHAEPGRFLEVGCGHGFMLAHIFESRLFGLCAGVDISLPSLLEAESRAGATHLAQADGDSLPFRAGTFDAVCLTEVIEHVPDQVALLREAVRVMAPGGILVVTAPNERLINRLKAVVYGLKLDRLLFWNYKPAERMDEEWHLHAMSRQSLARVVEAAELRPIRWIHLPGWWLPMRNLAVCRAQ